MRLLSPRAVVRARRRAKLLDERRQLYELLGRETPMLAVDAGARGRFLVDTADLHIGRSLFLARERQEMSVLERATAIVESLDGPRLQGSTLVDVGANIGTTTIPALLGGPFDHAIAVEPEPTNFLMLTLNLMLNGLEERVVARRVAATDTRGTARLLVAGGRSGNHRLTDGGDPPSNTEVVEIDTATLDELLLEQEVDPARVGLLWVDAEGSEDRVLAGAEALLDLKPPLVIELSPAQVGAAGGSQSALERYVARHYSHFVPFDLPHAHAGAGGVLSTRALGPFAAKLADGGLGKKKLDILAVDLSRGSYDEHRMTALARRSDRPGG